MECHLSLHSPFHLEHNNCPLHYLNLLFSFADNPCIPDISDPEYEEYELAWRRGTAALYESILAGRQDMGWFVPDCRLGLKVNMFRIFSFE